MNLGVNKILQVSVLALSFGLSACGGNTDQVEVKQQNAVLSGPPPGAPINPTLIRFSPRNNFTITRTSTGFNVKDNVGSEGSQDIVLQTKIKFSDMTVSLLVGDKSKLISASDLKTLIELYVAFFNRIPDAEGMIYWIDQIAGGMTIDELSDSFYDAAIQYADLTGYSKTMTDAEFVRVIYKNVLGRSGSTAPPDVDVNYWAKQLAGGASTKGQLVATMLNAAHAYAGDATWGWVPQLLDNKVFVGKFFAIQQGLNFNTDEDSITKGMNITSLITATDVDQAKAAIGVSDYSFDLTSTVPNSPEFDKVVAIVNTHCLQCHGPIRMENGVALYTNSLIRLNAQAMYLAVVVTKVMPQEGTLTQAERDAIATWYLGGAK